MLIIVDNEVSENPEDIVMVDDGTGQRVNIPSFLISFYDGY